MSISARNRIKSIIKKVDTQGLISILELETLEPTIITAIITRRAADEMELKEGDLIRLIIRPTEIIIKEINE